MTSSHPISQGRTTLWSNTSLDYATHRPDYPPSFYTRLRAFGIGTPPSHIADLGTGTGFLALQFARQGCVVSAVDISPGQIQQAQQAAEREQLSVDFRVASAEGTTLPSNTFDVVTAGQCWWYMSVPETLQEVRRILKPQGLFVTAHFSWLSSHDPVARATERLIETHNPAWTGGGWDGTVEHIPAWSRHLDDVHVLSHFVYDQAIPFTHETWRGRIRASRGVSVMMQPNEVARFDHAHAEMLRRTVPDPFSVLHRIDMHIFRL